MRLFDIPSAWVSVELALEEAGGELTPEMEARIRILLEGGAQALEDSMKLCRELEHQAEAAKAEAQRLQDRARSFDNQVDRIRGLMLPALLALGGKVKTPTFSFFTQTRRNVAFDLKPGAEIWEIPARFYRARDPELNKAELKKAEAAGEDLPEALVVVHSETTSLMVR